MSRFKSARTTEHGYFEERLSAYLDGELTSREYEAVEHHLETCSACQWDLETLGQTIQWTRELPTLTIPRVFTIPVPAEPERSSRRRRNFLPVLQGATALIAVLLVFAVAGDLMLGSLGGAHAPDALYQQEVASSGMEATQVVAKAVEEPVAAEAEVERTVVETIVLESEVVVTQTEAPMALRISPTEPLVSGEGMAPAVTPRVPEAEAAWKNAEEEVKEEDGEPVADAIATVADAAAPPAAEEAVAGGGVPTLTFPVPSPLRSVIAPTAVALATDLALAPAVERDESTAGTPSGPSINWLRVVEVSLGGALVLLVAATVFFTIERRRAR